MSVALTGENDDVACGPMRGSMPVSPTPTRPDRWPTALSGTRHAVGVNMALCDGSVHVINYSINSETYRRLGNRKDGEPIDGKGF